MALPLVRKSVMEAAKAPAATMVVELAASTTPLTPVLADIATAYGTVQVSLHNLHARIVDFLQRLDLAELQTAIADTVVTARDVRTASAERLLALVSEAWAKPSTGAGPRPVSPLELVSEGLQEQVVGLREFVIETSMPLAYVGCS